MALKTLIIDDEPIALDKLKKYVELTPQLTLSAACTDAFEAIRHLDSNDVDLIVTDINMPGLNGLDFIRSLRHQPLVIFTTAYSQYAVESYKVAAVDYLLKPYGFVEFSAAVAKAAEQHQLRNSGQAGASAPDSLFIKTDYRYVRVSLADIRYIKGYGEYLQIFIKDNQTPLMTLSSFAAIKESLTDNFLQIHRSYIVNMNHAAHIERARIVMDADTYIPVGDSYKAVLQNYLASRTVGKTGK